MIKEFPCQCGCGENAPSGEAYISGHDEICSHYRHWIVEYEIGNRPGAKPGGDDIVKHHYIYDHANPEKYTMKITRSKHMQLHGWMRKSGIIVPHINEDAGPWNSYIPKKSNIPEKANFILPIHL